MDPVVLAAGTALITAMATDAWQQARTAVVALWRGSRPEQADAIEKELAEVRAHVLAARQGGDADTERALAGSWQLRLGQLLRADPAAAAELQRVLREDLTPMLPHAQQAQIASISMSATAGEHAQVYQAGRDQHITQK